MDKLTNIELQNIEINGAKAKDIRFDDFKSVKDLGSAFDCFWKEVHERYSQEQLKEAVNSQGSKGIHNIDDVFGKEYYEHYLRVRERLIQNEKLKTTLEINGVVYKPILMFNVYYSGCESSIGWIVETKEGNKAVFSSNGILYFATKKEVELKIEEYRKAIQETEEALNLIS